MSEETRFTELAEDDGTVSMIDPDAVLKQIGLMVGYMTRPDKSQVASTELMRISAETKSSAYVRLIAEESVRQLAGYLLEEAPTIIIPFAVSHLNHFILAYRTLRPIDQDPGVKSDETT